MKFWVLSEDSFTQTQYPVQKKKVSWIVPGIYQMEFDLDFI